MHKNTKLDLENIMQNFDLNYNRVKIEHAQNLQSKIALVTAKHEVAAKELLLHQNKYF